MISSEQSIIFFPTDCAFKAHFRNSRKKSMFLCEDSHIYRYRYKLSSFLLPICFILFKCCNYKLFKSSWRMTFVFATFRISSSPSIFSRDLPAAKYFSTLCPRRINVSLSSTLIFLAINIEGQL